MAKQGEFKPDFSVIDYIGGINDLTDGLVRVIGDPDVRFREDPVRMMRAIEFASRLGFPSLPVTPTLLPLPLPVKYRLHFGAPMRFSGGAEDEDADEGPELEGAEDDPAYWRVELGCVPLRF